MRVARDPERDMFDLNPATLDELSEVPTRKEVYFVVQRGPDSVKAFIRIRVQPMRRALESSLQLGRA